MSDKLKKKLARQARAQERAMTYGTSGKIKNTTRRVYSKGNLWKHNDLSNVKADMKPWWKKD